VKQNQPKETNSP